MSLVKLKKSSVPGKVPLVTDLDYGELAINYADGKLYYKNSSNSIESISGSGAGGATVRSVQENSATSGQTVFTVTGGYTVGFIDVYLNGVLLDSSDYTATNTTSVTLASAAYVNDKVTFVKYQPVVIANLNTSNITEGTNLYFTNARARAAISVTGSGSYDSATGVITVTGGVTSVNTLTGAVTLTTTNIGEGTNLYYTDTRARAAHSFVAGSGAYNSTTGVITIPTNTNQLTNGAGFITGITSGNVTTALGFTPENSANKGIANGYASLDSGGKVPSAQLPSYVDDVLEYANLAAFPATGTSGIIYVTQDTNKTYRWTGSAYVEISPSPGTTDSLTEGSTNLYYTNTRARAAHSFVAGSGAYNSTTGVITIPTNTTHLTNGSNYITLGSLSFTAGSGAYNNTTGVITIPTNTSHLSEVTNLFYTDTRARAAHSFVAGSGAYNSTTGVITIPTNTNQLTNGAGFITSNQTITVSGDATGSGTTGISLTLANSGVTAGTYTTANITVDSKGRITAASSGTSSTLLQATTTNATTTKLTTDGNAATSSNQVILPNNSAYMFSLLVVARRQAAGGTESAAWKIEGLIRREGNASTTTLVNSAQTVIDNAPNWTIAVAADSTNGGLSVSVTGAASTNIKWIANVYTSQVTYA
jgi:hypothetical protein